MKPSFTPSTAQQYTIVVGLSNMPRTTGFYEINEIAQSRFGYLGRFGRLYVADIPKDPA